MYHHQTNPDIHSSSPYSTQNYTNSYNIRLTSKMNYVRSRKQTNCGENHLHRLGHLSGKVHQNSNH